MYILEIRDLQSCFRNLWLPFCKKNVLARTIYLTKIENYNSKMNMHFYFYIKKVLQYSSPSISQDGVFCVTLDPHENLAL